MSGEELLRKVAFFRQFEAWSGSRKIDEQYDEGMLASMLAMQQDSPNMPAVVETMDSPLILQDERCESCSSPSPAQRPQPRSKRNSDNVIAQDTPLAPKVTGQISVERPLLTGLSRPTVSAIEPVTTSNGIKRRRLDSGSKVPEHRKIFRGLKFFFVPNNDISPARRMRIRKAIDYGADWALEWHSSVSHIIVDRDLTYMDVLKYLKLSKLPAGSILVDEEYIAECISYGGLELPTLSKYQVKGHDKLQPVHKPAATSLPTKPAKRPDIVHEPQTPCRIEESDGKAQQDKALHHSSVISILKLDQPPGSRLDEREASDGIDDALREAIATAKAASHLPLDSDDDVESHPCSGNVSGESSGSEHESEARPKSKRKWSLQDPSEWQQKFQCMQDHTKVSDKTSNPNIRTIDILQEMQNYYHSIRDQWRSRAYRQAIATLRKQNKQITSKEAASALPFIGARLAAKIEEIAWTNKLRRLENTKLEPTDQALQLFLNIYGAGYVQASKWAQAGYTSLADLLSNPAANLTPNQRIGIEHYTDFCTRIPRAETARLGAIIDATLHTIDKDFSTVIGGSYRRGAQTSGDIDILITKPRASAAHLRTVVLDSLVPRLTSRGFLVAALAVTDRTDGSKWHGACQLPLDASTAPALVTNDPARNANPWRRIDLLLVPEDELGAAMIYFTGNDIFNRSMRLLARRKGMRLNQRGLYADVLRAGNVKVTQGRKVAGASERGVFAALGVPWREACERDI